MKRQTNGALPPTIDDETDDTWNRKQGAWNHVKDEFRLSTKQPRRTLEIALYAVTGACVAAFLWLVHKRLFTVAVLCLSLAAQAQDCKPFDLLSIRTPEHQQWEHDQIGMLGIGVLVVVAVGTGYGIYKLGCAWNKGLTNFDNWATNRLRQFVTDWFAGPGYEDGCSATPLPPMTVSLLPNQVGIVEACTNLLTGWFSVGMVGLGNVGEAQFGCVDLPPSPFYLFRLRAVYLQR